MKASLPYKIAAAALLILFTIQSVNVHYLSLELDELRSSHRTMLQAALLPTRNLNEEAAFEPGESLESLAAAFKDVVVKQRTALRGWANADKPAAADKTPTHVLNVEIINWPDVIDIPAKRESGFARSFDSAKTKIKAYFRDNNDGRKPSILLMLHPEYPNAFEIFRQFREFGDEAGIEVNIAPPTKPAAQ